MLVNAWILIFQPLKLFQFIIAYNQRFKTKTKNIHLIVCFIFHFHSQFTIRMLVQFFFPIEFSTNLTFILSLLLIFKSLSIALMQILQYCVDSRNKLSEVQNRTMPTKAKILLLESLRQRLKDVQEYHQKAQSEKQKLDLSTTFFTETKSIICREQEETLIQQILKKQRMKIEMDEQIQTCEDDLSQIEKTVTTKQAYSEVLSAKIAQKTLQLQQNSLKESKLQKVKSTPSLLKKIFG